MALKVHEIFYSLQGETTTSGFTSVFIRLAGCNLDCIWCDTPQAKSGGYDMTIDEIMAKVESLEPFNHITLTGGEPLIQEESMELLDRLTDNGYEVQVETNGSVLFDSMPRGVRIIADVKTPSSGQEGSFRIENIRFLKKYDEVKFVIGIMEDYQFAKDFIKAHLAGVECVINFAPATKLMEPWALANLIIKDRLNVRLNVQLHKIAKFQ
ncbi:MAG TPA: radical SAM protein [Spirochaetota bacterium]|nr:radical SAM protein [Spirochaetota bacterium]HPF04950.1 radical SAM protein [Spirochaetota bacterium]HPJ40935.1 radical SAM protein [Spirochaetota bacterium]HPR37816.1 radical SAM protein [Spirochaetota bacterium]HRX46613.1 radical SAM protein [Spirochaetota bacterium]